MSLISTGTGKTFQAGHFLVDNEDCTRLTVTVAANNAQVVTRADGSKYVPAGAIIPANGATAKGILYEDVDVSNGDAAGSIVTRGAVYTSLLPAAPASTATSALTGITFVATVPTITRPSF